MTWLARFAELHGTSDRLAVADADGIVTGRMLMSKAGVAADFLATLVDRAHVPIPALITTNADALALILGGIAAERPIAPLGPLLALDELAAMVRACGSPVILAEDRFAHIARDVARKVLGCRAVSVPALEVRAQPLSAPGGAIAFHLHTAGTTGRPKQVPFSQAVLTARDEVLCAAFGFSTDTRYATGSPLHHLGGLGNTLVALAAGGAVYPTVRFTVDWWRRLEGQGVTHCLLVPTMIEMLLTEGLLDAVGTHTLIYGGAPMAPETVRRVLEQLPTTRLFNLYGQTEGSPIAILDDDAHRRAVNGEDHLLRSAGKIVDKAAAHIDSPDGDGVGELVVCGDHLATSGPDGWLRTGDLGTFDSEGYLYLSGRRHDMIVRGGENIYPIEIEAVLRDHPRIRDAGVVGVPDQRLGETVAAFVVCEEDLPAPRTEDLSAAVRASLSAFKVPSEWHVVPELPYSAAGKLLRTRLLDMRQT